MSSNQNPTSEQNESHHHGEAPRNTLESPTDAQAMRQAQTHTGVRHPSPFEVTVRPQVQTAQGHIRNTSAQNQATVNNRQTHTPAYAGHNMLGHPPANS